MKIPTVKLAFIFTFLIALTVITIYGKPSNNSQNAVIKMNSLHSIHMLKIENESKEKIEPYIEFANVKSDKVTLYMTDACPIKDYEKIGQWVIKSSVEDFKLTKVPFEATKGNSGNNTQLTNSYKLVVSRSKDYENSSLYTKEFTTQNEAFVIPADAELKSDTNYYITLLAKDMIATPHKKGKALILSYDHGSLDDTVLGEFVQSGDPVSRKTSDIRFESILQEFDINTTLREHPKRECRVRYYSRLRSKWNTYFFNK